jgi:hypothetical protein
LQAGLDKLASILLQVAEGDSVQWLLNRFEKPPSIFTVCSLGVSASAMKPEFDQMLIGIGLLGDDKGGCGHRDQPASRVFVRMQDNTPYHA